MARRLASLLVIVGVVGLLGAFASVAMALEPPALSEVSVTGVGSESATLNAQIEDHETEASYRFEYGTGDCASNPCTSIPTSNAVVEASSGPVSVSQQLRYLEPGVTYHYRIVATNTAGDEASSDHTFHPFALTGNFELPDGRAWELVSPTDKNGGGVASVVTRIRAAASGNSVAYVSLAAFGDAQGLGTTAEYESVRDGAPGTSGWSTHSIMPKLEPTGQNAFFTLGRPIYTGEFSRDLTTGVLETSTNLSGDPNLENTANLYLRGNLETPGTGSYQTLSACSICTKPLVYSRNPRLVGASADFEHIAFEAWARLTSDAPNEPESCLTEGEECAPLLYEWNRGVVRYVGVLPAAEGGEPAPRSLGARAFVGQPEEPPASSVSADGSRILFTVPGSNFGSAGPLYMRVDHSSTIRISASENTGEPDPGASAVFQAANPNLSKVFFTSESQLTDTPGSGLYEYDSTKPAGHHLTLISGRPSSVLGVSQDGSYLYFITEELLLPGQAAFPSGAENGIYLWHDGTISLVGSVTNFDASYVDTPVQSLNGGSARVTPDGKHLLFSSLSGAGLTGYDQGCNGGCSELYLYSADSKTVRCVSCNPTGATATAEASFLMSTRQGGVGDVPHVNHPMSEDGRYVFFTTAERLVPEDHNGVQDVYEYDSQTEEVHLISSGMDSQPSYFMEASANGHDVFFTTFGRLVGWDVDNANDLYDARIDGGFPTPARPVECEGDACSAPFSAPTDPTPASATFSGPGNQESAAQKPTVKKKPRPVVKKKRPKIHKHVKPRKHIKRAKHAQAGRTHR